MLDQLEPETFEPHVGSAFEVAHLEGGAAFAATLAAVRRGPGGDGHRSFALEWHAPFDVPAAQGLHRLTHEELGTLELFLVPLGPQDGAMRYEAVFG